MISQSKIQAWTKLKESGRAKNIEEMLFRFLVNHGAHTTDELRQLGAHQTITGRLSALEEQGKVVKERNGKHSLWAAVTDPIQQQMFADMYRQEQYNRWKKNGIEKGYFTKAGVRLL